MHRLNLYLKWHDSLSTNSKPLQAIPYGAIVDLRSEWQKTKWSINQTQCKVSSKKSNILGWKYISLISVL